ncbi:hypothetical protein OJ997_29350 [Solirubrobacter phytolaccae]|uniref:Lyase n=1 Tax=Solirubrobacter phytolaccae TaxID=1404360 RepID=A0A9X3NG57_9ACTN|nr:hypothetical protein [Solirubrobacter phytolaccae]MDA0184447.1 hypothetical protein [Solirubrobacter phytolaccae]
MKALALAAAFTAPLGSQLIDLNVAPDGAAWVRDEYSRTVRVAPDGRVRATELPDPAVASTIGADGQAWFSDGDGGLQRVDANGRVTAPREAGVARPESGFDLVAGPDGGLWSIASGETPKLLRFTPDGGYHETPLALPGCDDAFAVPQLARAADGAVWADDSSCNRLVRVDATGAVATIQLPQELAVTAIAPDATGGVWFSALDPVGGHVTAAGEVTLLPAAPSLGRLTPWAVAVAPDGRPWFATQHCTLLTVNAAGAIERRAAPIPARELAFAPDGRLWLSSLTRVAHADAPTNRCDDKRPTIKVKSSVSLRRGVRITVNEPGRLDVHAYPAGGKVTIDRTFTLRRRGSVQLRFPKRWKLERGDAVWLMLQARDRDGNAAIRDIKLRVKL